MRRFINIPVRMIVPGDEITIPDSSFSGWTVCDVERGTRETVLILSKREQPGQWLSGEVCVRKQNDSEVVLYSPSGISSELKDGCEVWRTLDGSRVDCFMLASGTGIETPPVAASRQISLP